ncbi:MAG: ABC transporter substrate-binding protein [Mycobacteriales bacterium]|nr:MAG: peptide ABC transporter substrate-binding protein [Pseudonocardiales bacterium]
MKPRRLVAAVAVLSIAPAVAACADSNKTGGGKGGGVFTTIDGDHAINVNAPINPYNGESNAFAGYNSMNLAWPKNSLSDPNAFYPGVAKDWSLSSDGTKLTIDVQPKAKWSDGSDVTAQDIKTSAAVAFTQGGGAFVVTPGAAGGLGDVKVLGAKKVEFDQAGGTANNTFERNVLTMSVVPDSVFGSQLPKDVWTTIHTAVGSTNAAATKAQNTITALGKKLVDFGPKKDVSCGPFVLERVNPSAAILTKNKDFWDADKIAPAQVQLLNYAGNQQIWNYLIAGKLDAAPYTATPTNVVKQILKTKGNATVSGFSPVDAALAFNESIAPFGNVHVRRGLAYLIDRKLVTKIGEPESGTASKVTTGLIAPAATQQLGSDFVSKLNPYEESKTKAASEFRAAGMHKSGDKWLMSNGKQFTVNVQVPTGFSDWIAGGQSIASQLTSFGIASKPATSADYATYLSDLADGKFAVGFWLVALGPSNYNAYQRLYGSANGWNVFGHSVKHSAPGKDGNWMGSPQTQTVPGVGTVDPGALTNQLSALPLDRQKAAVQKLATISNDQLPVIQLWDYTNVQFLNTNKYTNFPKDNSDVLRLSAGVWMQLGYINAK